VAAPVRLLDVPNGHVEQLLLPFVALYVPSGHALQLMAGRLPLLKNPSLQKSHVFAPVWLLNVPAGQFAHSRLRFVELFVPKGQKVQMIAPSRL
jgi:hypothetical protein